MRTQATNVVLCVALSMGIVPLVLLAQADAHSHRAACRSAARFGSPQLLAISPDGRTSPMRRTFGCTDVA